MSRNFKDELKVANFMDKKDNLKIQEFKKERYTAPKGTANKKRKINKKRIIEILGIAGLLTFGGIKGCADYQKQHSPITLTQALENGDSLEELGIDEKIKTEINDINAILESDEISNKDIIELASRINNLQFDTIKTKLAGTLGVEEDDIKLYTELAEEGTTRESIKVKGGETYINKELFLNNNTITNDISDYIKEIGKMQTIIGQIQNQSINRNDILKKYKSAMKNTDKFAAAKMDIDDKGNISMDYTKVSELYTAETKGEAGNSNLTNSQQIEDEER